MLKINTRSTELAATILPLSAMLALLNFNAPLGLLAGDSEQCINYAKAIESGEIFDLGTPAPISVLLRTPLYPLLLVVASWATGDLRSGVLLINLLGAVVALILVGNALQPWLHPIITRMTFAGLIAQLDPIFTGVMPEFLSLCLLVSYGSLTIYSLRNRAFVSRLGGCAIAVSLYLLKPVFIFLLLLEGLVVLSNLKRTSKGQSQLQAAILITPVVLLTVFNYVRFSLPTPAAMGNVSLFGIAAGLSDLSPEIDDSQSLQATYALVRSTRREIIDQEIPLLSELRANSIFVAVAENYEMSLRLYNLMHGDAVAHSAFTKRYIARSLRQDYERYFAYVLGGLASIRTSWPYILLLALSGAFFLSRRQTDPILLAALQLLVIHLGNILACSLTSVMHGRYFYLTHAAFSFMAILLAFHVFKIGLADLCSRLKSRNTAQTI